MQLLKSFWKIFNFIFPFSDFLYILQQEEYSSARLIKWLPRFYFRRGFQVREKLKLTMRTKLTLLGSVGIYVLLNLIVILTIQMTAAQIVIVFLLNIAIPLIVLFTNYLSTPFFDYLKQRVRNKAIAKRRKSPNLKVVTVAGSYGKTTVKNFIYQLIKYNYRTQMIPGNINTPDGIAAWVLNSLENTTELLIAEVDGYQIGEIKLSGEILKSDIAILTNIGDQHLERFGNRGNLAIALNEVFTTSKDDAKLVTTRAVINELETLNIDVDQTNLTVVEQSENINYQQNNISTDDLSESNKINLQFALVVADSLNIPTNFVLDTAVKLELPDRRQSLTNLYGYEAIDDSYNISFTTAQAGIAAAKTAATKAGKKLLIVTAGIPELAKDSGDNIRKLGRIAAESADHVIVLRSMFANQLAAGVHNQSKVSIKKDLNSFLKTAHQEFPPTVWFLLMQPELGDLYY